MPTFVNARDRYVLKRFAIKLGIVCVGAVAESWMPWGFGGALLVLTVMSAMIDVLLASYHRERLALNALGYWDEALAFIAISLVTLVFL